jgi:hypothetical protein
MVAPLGTLSFNHKGCETRADAWFCKTTAESIVRHTAAAAIEHRGSPQVLNPLLARPKWQSRADFAAARSL